MKTNNKKSVEMNAANEEYSANAAPELRVAYFQQDIAWEAPEENYRLVEEAFATMEGQADMLIVPETFNTGFSDNMAAMAEEPGGPTLKFAHRMAQQHDALFVGTWTVKDQSELHPGQTVVYNRLHWVRPDGSYGYYDKGHTFRVSTEASQLERGQHRSIFEWRGWHIKPAICYDLRFPKWLRTGNPPDYDLILLCANWPGSRAAAWDTLLRARAIENEAYAVGVNRVGVDGTGIPYAGHSAAIDFKGLALSACDPEVAQVRTATLDKAKLEHFREHWPFYLDFD